MKRYKIRLNSKTLVTVNEQQIFNKVWVKHFGSIENIKRFINQYKED